MDSKSERRQIISAEQLQQLPPQSSVIDVQIWISSFLTGSYWTPEWNDGAALSCCIQTYALFLCCRYFFSLDGSPTVLAKQGGAQMGQRTHLSQLDIQKLNRLYHCGDGLLIKLLQCVRNTADRTYSNSTTMFFFFQTSGWQRTTSLLINLHLLRDLIKF